MRYNINQLPATTDTEPDEIIDARAREVWHLEYVGYVVAALIIVALFVLLAGAVWHVLTTPTADRSPLMNWWMS